MNAVLPGIAGRAGVCSSTTSRRTGRRCGQRQTRRRRRLATRTCRASLSSHTTTRRPTLRQRFVPTTSSAVAD